jgi:hypothetical protein
MNVKEILHREPPSVLYHYTTQQGLLGIISNKEIWATHTQYLNDVREFRHATELAKEELSLVSNVTPPEDKVLRDRLWEMKNAVSRTLHDVNVCVCSFSEDGDVLSQWRAYGGPVSGFAIGFSGEDLREMSHEWGWLVPVVYEEEEQRRVIRNLLNDVLQELQELRNPAKERERPAGNLVAYLNRYAPILKHKAFQEEHEWRVVTRPLLCTLKGFGYRTGPSMLIPYFRLSLENRRALAIREIVIGPTPHPEQSLRSVHGLLTKNRIEVEVPYRQGVRIRVSAVPYRNW